MAPFMNQILAYRISAGVKINIYKEGEPQIEAQYMNLTKMAQSTFH